jgi:hypothetical protein
MKSVFTLLTVALVALALPAIASAGNWAGSRYDKSDCTYTKETDSLFCEAWFTEEEFTTEQSAVADASCESGLRIIERTGWQVTTYRGWGVFTGRVPHARNEVVGNEDGFSVTWRDYVDVDRGCYVQGAPP